MRQASVNYGFVSPEQLLTPVPAHTMNYSPSLDIGSASKPIANMTMLHQSLRRYCNKTLLLLGLLLLLINVHVFFGCSVFNLFPRNTSPTASSRGPLTESPPWIPTRKQGDLRISKATIQYDSKTYETRNLALDETHTHNFGYKTHALRTPMVRGALNKLLYLQSLILVELQKPVEEQEEWILYYGPTVIFANPRVPLHHFLPPVTDVETFKTLSIIATMSESEKLNTAVFFIRVSAGSVRVLIEALERMYNAPAENEIENADISAIALKSILSRDHHREKIIFQPAEWYNSTTSLFYQAYRPTPRHHLLPITEKLAVDSEEQSPMFPDAETVHRFWHIVSEARRVLNEAKEKGHTSEQGAWWEMDREVKEWAELRAWDTDELERRLGVLKEGLDIS
jgi:hypothetical protein